MKTILSILIVVLYTVAPSAMAVAVKPDHPLRVAGCRANPAVVTKAV